jgi:hypothetical protein
MSLMIKKLVAVALAAAVLAGGVVTANAHGWYDHGHGYGYGFGYHNYWSYGDYYGCSFVSRPWGTVKVCPNAY